MRSGVRRRVGLRRCRRGAHDRRAGADRARPGARRRDEAPARAPASRRLVGGRARVERDDDRASTSSGSTSWACATRDTDRKLANELLARRRADGTWSNWFEGPADLSTTIESYVALKMAGVDPAPRRASTSAAQGGIPESARVHEVLPRAARPVAVAAHSARAGRDRPAPAVGAVLDLQLRLLGPPDRRAALGRAWRSGPSGPRASTCARSARGPARRGRPRGPGRCAAARSREAERWVRDRQEADGGWGGIQPPWVWSIIMLAALGHGFEDAQLRARGRGLGRVHDRRGRPAAPRGVPVAGLGHRRSPCSACAPAASRPTTRSSCGPASGCSPRRSTVKGDWAVRRPRPRARRLGVRVRERPLSRRRRRGRRRLALRELGIGEDAVERGLAWIEGMQSSNGGWGAFDVDNTSDWLYKIPFCDFGAVIDPPSEDVAAHALEALAPEPATGRRPSARPRLPARASRRTTAPGGAAGA